MNMLAAPKRFQFIFLMQVDKDRRINFLRSEIERQDQLCGGYREQLLNFMNIVEQQNEELSLKLQGVVENIRKLESEMSMYSRHR